MNFLELGQVLCGQEVPNFLHVFDLATAPTLLYYSYIPILVTSLLIGSFIFLNSRKLLQAKVLLVVIAFFTLWVINILAQWITSFNVLLMFAWQMTMLLEVGLYLSVAYFAYVFFFQKDLPSKLKILFLIIYLAVLVITPTNLNIQNYDVLNCQGNNGVGWNFVYALEPSVILITVWMGIVAQSRLKKNPFRPQVLILTGGISIFLTLFFLSNYYGEITKIYEFNFWGPLGMFVFVALLGYLIVQYKAFNAKLLGAQALVVTTTILTGSEFFFVTSQVNRTLVSATLLLTMVFGYFLVRGVQREIQQREKIEKLAIDLEATNKQQVILIHFITHQIKGFVAKSRNIFAGIREGDYGVVPDTMKPMIEEGFRSDTKGAQTIQEILNAANIKSGKVEYSMTVFDLRTLIDEIAADLKAGIEAKGLALNLELGTDPVLVKGDRGQLTNAYKNVIDNSVKYTKSGSITVKLAKEAGKVVFTVTDTGVGITADDMKNLFTEGGHGKDSQKVNVDSTGFGLYIVKSIIEAHKGTVRAESEGAGKGSRFIVELPA